MRLKGNIKSVRECQYSAYGSTKHHRQLKLGGLISDETTYFNEQGYRTNERIFIENHSLQFSTYSLLPVGNELVNVCTDSTGDTLDIWIYIYDDSCRFWKEERYTKDFVLRESYVRLYDSRNEVISRIEFDSLGHQVERFEYSYNPDSIHSNMNHFDRNDSLDWSSKTVTARDGKSSKSIFYYSTGAGDFINKDAINDNGDEIRNDFFKMNGKFDFGESYTYEYDSYGNWTRRTETRRGDYKSVFVTERTIEYRN